jgi:hypothetical protein
MKLSLPLAIVLLLGTGCAHAPRTYVFASARPQDEALDLLARRLEQEGHKVSLLDRRSSEIITYWEKVAARSGGVPQDDRDAGVFVRYRVALQTVEVAHKVRVSAELQRCDAEAFTITAIEVVGACRDAWRIPPDVQQGVNDLGERLSSELSSAPGAGAAAVVSTR